MKLWFYEFFKPNLTLENTSEEKKGKRSMPANEHLFCGATTSLVLNRSEAVVIAENWRDAIWIYVQNLLAVDFQGALTMDGNPRKYHKIDCSS